MVNRVNARRKRHIPHDELMCARSARARPRRGSAEFSLREARRERDARRAAKQQHIKSSGIGIDKHGERIQVFSLFFAQTTNNRECRIGASTLLFTLLGIMNETLHISTVC